MSFIFLNAQEQSEQLNNSLPEAYNKKKIVKKNPYICEVHFENGNYQELNRLEDFTGEYQEVKKVILMYLELTEFPSNLSKFQKLETLDLSHNKLKIIDASYFKQFSKLKTLYLNDNLMEDIEIDVLDSQLQNVTVYNKEEVSK